jgi:uncharacterized protein YjdB
VLIGTGSITVTVKPGRNEVRIPMRRVPVPEAPEPDVPHEDTFVAVSGVSLNKSATGILVGGTETLTATITPSHATNQNVTWTSSDNSVATVDNTGLVTAVADGTATITVTTVDGSFTAPCMVTVSSTAVAVTGVSLNKGTLTLVEGGMETLTVTITPSYATNQNLTWTSSATAVATVNNGVVNAVAAGTASITVTTDDGGFTAACTVTVTAPVTGVSLNKTALSLVVYSTEILIATVAPANATNQNVTWTSSVPAVATVDNNTGLVTAVTAGTVTITATTEDGGKTANCIVSIPDIPNLSGVNVPFRYVPSGSFQRDDTAANVTIITKGYWMGETEVTQELFEAVMGTNPSQFTSGADVGETQTQRPVEKVSWYDAIAFCNKLSLANGKQPVYSVSGVTDWNTVTIPTTSDPDWNAAIMDTAKNGYRLPTEMEWMWAAMGADTMSQPNTTGYLKAFAGDDGSNSIGDCVWYYVNSINKTHEVGKKHANELGLYDMSGNVWEWCWDWYGSYQGGTQTDPQGSSSGINHVVRGGSWNETAANVRSAYRSYSAPSNRDSDLGFRLVRPQF